MSNSTSRLLKQLPNIFNKNPGNPGPMITLPGTGAQTQIQTGASNVYQVMDSIGFTLDLLFKDIISAREELYIGVNPTNINIAYFPTEEVIVLDNFGETVIDQSGDIIVTNILSLGSASLTVDLNYYFFVNATSTGITIILPDPSDVLKERYTVVKNTGSVIFFMYGLTVYPGQTIIFNWVPQSSLSGMVILGRWVIAAGSYYSFNPQINGTVASLNPPNLNNQFDIISSFTLVSNISNINTISVYQQIINPGQSVLFQWNKLTSTWNSTQSNYIYELIPDGADSLSGNFYLPGGNTWLDNVGISYGSPRVYEETDNQYKSRIREMVIGPKLTVPGISTIFAVVFNFYPQIFNWYQSDYTQMVSLISGASAFQYNAISNQMIPYSITGEPNYPNSGPNGNFYILVNSGSTVNLNDAVYTDFSFNDWPNGAPPSTPNYSAFGGFYQSNPGETLGSNTNILTRMGQVLEAIKEAGTVPIIVVLPG